MVQAHSLRADGLSQSGVKVIQIDLEYWAILFAPAVQRSTPKTMSRIQGHVSSPCAQPPTSHSGNSHMRANTKVLIPFAAYPQAFVSWRRVSCDLKTTTAKRPFSCTSPSHNHKLVAFLPRSSFTTVAQTDAFPFSALSAFAPVCGLPRAGLTLVQPLRYQHAAGCKSQSA